LAEKLRYGSLDRDKRARNGLANASPSAGLPEVRGGCLLDEGWRFNTPRGLTSNRHAGRPDRMTVRAFFFSNAILALRSRNERRAIGFLSM
jgi:hypothetical protein